MYSLSTRPFSILSMEVLDNANSLNQRGDVMVYGYVVGFFWIKCWNGIVFAVVTFFLRMKGLLMVVLIAMLLGM